MRFPLPALAFAKFSLVLTLLLLSAGPAGADFKVCNETDNRLGIALGYSGPKGWASEGWWNVEPHKCTKVMSGRLASRYFYVHVIDYGKGRARWDGTHTLCTQRKLFTIKGTHDCKARGFESAGFFEIDTRDFPAWTVSLEDNQQISTVIEPIKGGTRRKFHNERIAPTQ